MRGSTVWTAVDREVYVEVQARSSGAHAVYADAADTMPPQVPRAGDIGDWIDPNAPDPTPEEIVDRNHPDYVDPWFGGR